MRATALTWKLFLFACLVGSGVGAAADTTVVRRTVSLKSDGKEITAIVLENTHARSFRDPSSGSQYSLTEKAEGVIWRVDVNNYIGGHGASEKTFEDHESPKDLPAQGSRADRRLHPFERPGKAVERS